MFWRRVPRSSWLVGTSLLVLGTSGAQAQTASPTATTALEEIVVTAQRRAENLQEVPLAVTALSGATLSKSGVDDTQELSQVAPGLVFTRVVGAAQPFLRGIGSYNVTVGDENPTAVYIDGVYLASMQSGLFSFNNIQRVEVLRGPQGTLFGRNAAAGVIQIATRDPQQEAAGDASVSYGSYGRWGGSLYATSGLGPNVAADIAVSGYDQTKGFGRNLIRNEKAYYESNFGARSKWLVDLGETRLTFAIDFNRFRADYGSRSSQTLPGYISPDGTSTPRGRYDTVASFTDPVDTKQYGASLKIQHPLSFANFVSITAWREVRGENPLDQDGGPLAFGDAPIYAVDYSKSQEFQLLSKDDSKVSWVLGAFYFTQNAKYQPLQIRVNAITLTTPVPIPALGQTINAPIGIFQLPGTMTISINTAQHTNSYAAFAQGSIEVFENARITLGGRFTRDERRMVGDAAGGPLNRGRATFNKFTYKAALDYNFTPDILGYVQYSRGFKSGLYNLVNPYAPPVRPSVLDATEIGLKSELLDHRLRINASAFHYDIKDLQVNQIVLGTQSLFNAAAAKVKGGELEIEAAPADRLSLRASAAYVDGKFKSFPGAPLFYPNPLPSPYGGLPGFVNYSGDAAGNRLPQAPKLTLILGGSYEVPASVGDLSVSANLTRKSKIYQLDNKFSVPASTVVNATVGWESPDDRWTLQLTARNLFDKKILTYRQPAFLPYTLVQTYADPRTLEARLGMKW